MLKVLSSPKKLCDGFTRRDLLRAGGLSLFGLSLPNLLRLQAARAAPVEGDGGFASGGLSPLPRSFGQAKACILLYLYGSPSQLELADMKPEAPVEIRGELGGIESSLPGVQVCELLPNLARVMDRTTVVRSLTHPYPIHGVAYAITGIPQIDVTIELSPFDEGHWPCFGSVVDYLERQKAQGESPPASRGLSPSAAGSNAPQMPAHIALPFPFSSRRKGEVPRAGPYAGFLGPSYNPVWTEFEGQATRSVVRTLRDMTEEFADPYLGMTPESRFLLAAGAERPAEITIDRLDRRRSLLEQLDAARAEHFRQADARNYDRFQEMAFSLITSERMRTALDIQSEPMTVRESYGMTLFGQATLAARRLVEAGTKLVSVFWDEYGLAGYGWDTHWEHYPRMRGELLPGLDRAYAGLIEDLDQRGMLDETLVVVLSEHGRTPRLNNANGGGRDHWSQVYSGLFAGGGVKRGNVVGASDHHGSEVADRPVSPKDILATIYHLLGIDHHQRIIDRTGRPVPLVEGEVVHEMVV